MKKNSRHNQGFTLIELIVSMAVFIILLGIIVNIFVSALRTQRSMVSLRLVNDNASLTLEQMAREIRTGYNFYIGDGKDPCAKVGAPVSVSSGDKLGFCNSTGSNIVYNLDSESIKRSIDDGKNFNSITGDNVKIKKLNFILVDKTSNFKGEWPPRITIVMELIPGDVNLSEFTTNIQTTISGRNIR